MSDVLRDRRLARLARSSRVLADATAILLVLLVAGGLGIWLKADWVKAIVAPRIGLDASAVTLGGAAQLGGLALTAVPLLILAYGLFQVRLVFLDFAAGNVISRTIARRLELFGGAVALQAALNPFIGAALSVVVTLGNPPGRRMLAISLSSHDVVSFLVGLLLIAIGWVMHEAARIADENAGFI